MHILAFILCGSVARLEEAEVDALKHVLAARNAAVRRTGSRIDDSMGRTLHAGGSEMSGKMQKHGVRPYFPHSCRGKDD